MKRLTIVCSLALLGCMATSARADYAYGGFGPGYSPYYDHARPWWGGLSGWGAWHGATAYPAYRCAEHCAIVIDRACIRRRRTITAIPTTTADTPNTREFIYDWSQDAGDMRPMRGSLSARKWIRSGSKSIALPPPCGGPDLGVEFPQAASRTPRCRPPGVLAPPRRATDLFVVAKCPARPLSFPSVRVQGFRRGPCGGQAGAWRRCFLPAGFGDRRHDDRSASNVPGVFCLPRACQHVWRHSTVPLSHQRRAGRSRVDRIAQATS